MANPFKKHSLARLPIALAAVLCACSAAHADFYVHFWENHHENQGISNYRLIPSYFTTSSNFDSQGTKTTPSGLNNYDRIVTDLNLSYGITNDFTAYGRLSWGYVNQNSSIRPGSSYGMMDQTIGLNYRALTSNEMTIDLQTQLDLPFYSNSNSEKNLTPYLGDGTTDWTTGLHLSIPIAKNQTHGFDLSASAGYTYRNQGFSSAIPWTTLGRYIPLKQGFYSSLGFIGILSFQTDSTTLQSVRSNIGGGGSFTIGAVNPSIVQVQGTVGYEFGSRTAMYLSATQAIWGQYVPVSFLIGLGLQVRFGEKFKGSPFNLSSSEYGHSNSGFQTYSLDSHILKVNRRLNLVKIDKGSQDGIEMGQVFDIFTRNESGLPLQAVARAKVSSVRVSETALEITEYYTDVLIEEGFLAKRLVQ